MAPTCWIQWQLTVMLWGVCEYFVYNNQPGVHTTIDKEQSQVNDIVMGRGWNMDKN